MVNKILAKIHSSNFVSASAGGSTTGVSVEDGDLAVGATISGNTWAFSSN